MIEVNYPQWNELKQLDLVIVDFWAPWCTSCKSVEQLLVSIEADFLNLRFVKINVDDNKFLSHELSVRNIPSVILYKKGNEVKRWNVFVGQQQMKYEIAMNIKSLIGIVSFFMAYSI